MNGVWRTVHREGKKHLSRRRLCSHGLFKALKFRKTVIRLLESGPIRNDESAPDSKAMPFWDSWHCGHTSLAVTSCLDRRKDPVFLVYSDEASVVILAQTCLPYQNAPVSMR